MMTAAHTDKVSAEMSQRNHLNDDTRGSNNPRPHECETKNTWRMAREEGGVMLAPTKIQCLEDPWHISGMDGYIPVDRALGAYQWAKSVLAHYGSASTHIRESSRDVKITLSCADKGSSRGPGVFTGPVVRCIDAHIRHCAYSENVRTCRTPVCRGASIHTSLLCIVEDDCKVF